MILFLDITCYFGSIECWILNQISNRNIFSDIIRSETMCCVRFGHPSMPLHEIHLSLLSIDLETDTDRLTFSLLGKSATLWHEQKARKHQMPADRVIKHFYKIAHISNFKNITIRFEWIASEMSAFDIACCQTKSMAFQAANHRFWWPLSALIYCSMHLRWLSLLSSYHRAIAYTTALQSYVYCEQREEWTKE